MIFGFNTDVKHADTVYHVQSEAQPNTQLLLTTVFVQGRCLGKKSSSYADWLSQSDYSEQMVHELLKTQHRQVLDSIREGQIEQAISVSSSK